MSTYWERIDSEWQAGMVSQAGLTQWLEQMQRDGGEIKLSHYASYLRETYFYTRDSPDTMGIAAKMIPYGMYKIHKKLLAHASSEISHDNLALEDMRAIGVDPESVINGKPLATTEALIAWQNYCATLNIESYMGYMYHLEKLPTEDGADYIEMLKGFGIPDNAFSFIEEHAEADVKHIKLLKLYVEAFVNSEEAYENFVHAMKVTMQIHSSLVIGALGAVH